MRETDAFVVLTRKAREILFSGSGSTVEVIPCCVDLEKRFQGPKGDQDSEIAARIGLKGRFVFAHVGALGGLYLTNELVDFLTVARSLDRTTFALFLTQSDPEPIRSLLEKNGFSENDYYVGKVDPVDIPVYLELSNVGLSFVKATYATQSRSPTKIPEYLAAGLPIIANSGVGDVDELIREDRVGVLMDRFDGDAYEKALHNLESLGEVGEKCRRSAAERFDLRSVGGVRYRRLYERLFCKDSS
jgi:glycosyltransferase involved in cell wall biosynthesis